MHRTLVKLGIDSLIINGINNVLQKISSPFQKVSTEALRFAHFKEHKTFILPENHKLGDVKVIVQKDHKKRSVHKEIVAQFTPIKKVLKLFFEPPEVLDSTLKHLEDIEKHSKLIENLVQGSIWKEKIEDCKDKIVFPLIMSFDDYETNNPLGSHKGVLKCGAVYLSFQILPPQYQAKLENIFFFVLFNTKNRVQFTKLYSLKQLKKFNFFSAISSVISVTVNDETKQNKFTLYWR